MSSFDPRHLDSQEVPTELSEVLRELQSPSVASLIDLVRDDFGSPLFRGEDESQMIISQAVRRAMDEKGISLFELHERSQLPIEDLQNLLTRAKIDLRDSDPLVRLEQALGTSLRHL